MNQIENRLSLRRLANAIDQYARSGLSYLVTSNEKRRLKVAAKLNSKTRTQTAILAAITRLVALQVIIAFLPGCNGQEETITGSVNLVDRDETQQLAAVTITILPESDDPEATEEYFVANNDKGQELMELDGALVIATGTVRTDEQGNKTIYIRQYRVMQEEEIETNGR